MYEDKAETLQKLVEAINTTREGSETRTEDQITMAYKTDYTYTTIGYATNEDGSHSVVDVPHHYSEAVVIYKGENLLEVVNVAADSCMAMMRDVLKARCFQ